jgi:hypothetical protein
MTSAEVDAFLVRCPQMVVGAIDSDGWPTATLAATRFVNGLLSVDVAEADPLINVLAGDSSVCCVADEHESYYEIRGVIIHGHLVAAEDAGEFTLDAGRTISFDFGRLER